MDPFGTTDVRTEQAIMIKIKKPSQYRIDILNDDVTPFLFVMFILNQIFKKSMEDSAKIAEEAHEEGKAMVGIYSYDVAKTYLSQAEACIKEMEVPLKLTMKKVEE